VEHRRRDPRLARRRLRAAPAPGAPGCWLLALFLLLALGLIAAALSLRRDGNALALVPQAAAGARRAAARAGGRAELGLAPQRHRRGRASAAGLGSQNGLRDFLNQERRVRFWETEGVESSVALLRRLGMAFAVNGKIDGHFTIDAPTQVMSGLLAALLHEQPKSALVIGLGTGSTAGWLGAIPAARARRRGRARARHAAGRAPRARASTRPCSRTRRCASTSATRARCC
jgi:hypothetical protein